MAKPFNAGDWDVTVGGLPLRWNRMEVTFEQFHTPAQFCIEAPLESVNVPDMLTDLAPEVVVKYQGNEFFVGLLDDSEVTVNAGDQPGDLPSETARLTGRDLSSKFVMAKIVEQSSLPTNQTASEMVIGFCREQGFKDLSKITATSHPIGDFISHNYHRITQHLSQHDVLFDLAELEGFLFRVVRRQPFFGPQETPTKYFEWMYRRDFNLANWRKSHTNSDVTVRVLGWNKRKQRIAQTQGNGSLVVTRIHRAEITVAQAKAEAIKVLAETERGLLGLKLTDVPGDPALNDVTFGFHISGIAKGVDQTLFPGRVHHVITQDDHVMDVDLVNKARIVA